jgi:L-seryl-tRNA(Ser) seleniumtransferase
VDDPRRLTPRMDDVLRDERLQAALCRLGRGLVKQAAAAALERCRSGLIGPDDVADTAVLLLPCSATSMRWVVNATGVVVHTNLGRAPLSSAAVDALAVAAGATNVELDLASGRRDTRGRGALAALAAAIPLAAETLVVNNGAAALALVTATVAAGRPVVVSRGELVEIGDGFRIPELLAAAGATLREVGTTNRVRLADYQAAVDEATAFVLKVHPSNFVVEGFTSSVGVADLATLPVPVVADIGSGLLEPHPRLPNEPSASAALRAGAAVVTCSGDKLLGGPQCGLILGRADLVQRMRRHPMARAFRVDKLTLAALEATLRGPRPPVLAALACSRDQLMTRADAMSQQLRDAVAAHPVPSTAAVGGGGAPGVLLDSAAVSLPASLADALRVGDPAVVGRIEGGRLLLDLVAVDPADDGAVVDAVRRAAKE